MTVLLACSSASDGLALEAVALPSDGAGSGSGAVAYALGNQVGAQNAMIAAQGAVIQQLNGSVTSLTTTVNNLSSQVSSQVAQMNTLTTNVNNLTQIVNKLNQAQQTPKSCPSFGLPGDAVSESHSYNIPAEGSTISYVNAVTRYPGCKYNSTSYQCQGARWNLTSTGTYWETGQYDVRCAPADSSWIYSNNR